jgi:hypothetical protein
MMWFIGALLAAVPAAAQVASWDRQGNTVRFHLGAGSAEVDWLTASTFRFSRCWPGEPCVSRSSPREKFSLQVEERGGVLESRTEYLRVRVQLATLAIEVDRARGKAMLRQAAPAAGSIGGGLSMKFTPQPDERFYGLGALDQPAFNLRGLQIRTHEPLLISSAGYGLYFSPIGQYRFDLDGGRIEARQARQWEQWFYYGPGPKEIHEEHARVRPPVLEPAIEDLGRAPRFGREIPSLESLAQASMSGILAPLVASRLAWRKWLDGAAWNWYLITYLIEGRDRGLPVIRPLAMQFDEDAEAWKETSTVMIGDELLVGLGAEVYLPRGIWTHWETNEIRRGRQRAPAGPWARNGTIVPFERAGVLELHYFPRLGAEFFLTELSDDSLTQFHAGPAGEYLRLEIESQVARRYEWVAHHVSDAEDRKPEWRYDEKRRELRIPVTAAANSDIIINIILKEKLE